MNVLPKPPDYFIDRLKRLGHTLRDSALRARKSKNSLAGVARESAADTIYQIDAQVEPVLESFCQDWAKELPLILIAEGAPSEGGKEGICTFPRGADPDQAAFRLLVDPIDGTRGLMYDKRSAWVLAGIAPNNGPNTRLVDIQVALQAEIPTSRQYLADTLWAIAGQGVHGQRADLLTGKHATLAPSPSTAPTIEHGFASVTSFFPGTKQLAAELMELIVERTIGPADVGKATVFDDQYISTAGQFYELIVGHDRFNADLRPYFYDILQKPPGLCCHPYDCATWLIAKEAGILLTNGRAGPLDGPLDTQTPIAWAAYANASLRQRIEPVILGFLRRHGIP